MEEIRPIKDKREILKHAKLRNVIQRRCEKYINKFLKLLEDGYEAMEIQYSSRTKLEKEYDSMRNIVERRKLPIKVSRDIKHLKVWLFHWTEEDERIAKEEGIEL